MWVLRGRIKADLITTFPSKTKIKKNFFSEVKILRVFFSKVKISSFSKVKILIFFFFYRSQNWQNIYIFSILKIHN